MRGGEVRARYDAPASSVAVTSNLPRGTFALTGTGTSEAERDSEELQGGILTHYFLKGLTGAANSNRDGIITADELGRYVVDQAKRHADTGPFQRHLPSFWSNHSEGGSVIITQGTMREFAGVIVGLSHYAESSFPPLKHARRDGQLVFDAFNASASGAPGLSLLLDEQATEKAIVQAVERAASLATPETPLLFYFSGHGFVGQAGGEVALACYDSSPRQLHTLVALESIKGALERSVSQNHLLILDAVLPSVKRELPVR
jgi:uncharacterized caspase-like protein